MLVRSMKHCSRVSALHRKSRFITAHGNFRLLAQCMSTSASSDISYNKSNGHAVKVKGGEVTAAKGTNYTAETLKIPSRDKILQRLKKDEEFDLLIIGGGATGAGAALDAALRGLKVACVEREDFSSGTSSRSTKLLWGGSRYLVQAFVSLLSPALFKSPVSTVKKFVEEFRMVLNCHRERRFLLTTQPHLTKWLPIAVPLDKWFIWPPPFNFYPAALGALGLFPAFFKFYDALGAFCSPPSHIMTQSRARRKFPQLSQTKIKYCPIFYEGSHDDSRTNIAIAQTAAAHGAAIANYCEVVSLRKDASGRVVGATVKDVAASEKATTAATAAAGGNNSTTEEVEFNISAKSVLLCGGPFTDEIRALEDDQFKPAVNGASGVHIVLPHYYAPEGIGLVDMNTSDGRFLFFLPWKGHVVVGTTDHKCKPTMRPVPDESEIKWILHEASKYLSPELQLRRHDVLSAWSGVRPLAVDPHAASTAAASRDHVISHNVATGVVFVSGGKWTTYREMAEDAVDKVLEVAPQLKKDGFAPCRTLQTSLVGFEGYSENLRIRLIQEYEISESVAKRLADTYGGRARDVLEIAKQQLQERSINARSGTGNSSSSSSDNDTSHLRTDSSRGRAVAMDDFFLDEMVRIEEDEQLQSVETLLDAGYPIIEAEVIFAARFDWALHPEDFLARRSRLAFLNKDVAVRCIPRIVQLMARELKWDYKQQRREMQRAVEYMRHFGGPLVMPSEEEAPLRLATRADLLDVFKKTRRPNTKGLSRADLLLACEMLNHPLSTEEIEDCCQFSAQQQQQQNDGRSNGTVVSITADQFVAWWNSERCNPLLVQMKSQKMATTEIEGTGALFG